MLNRIHFLSTQLELPLYLSCNWTESCYVAHRCIVYYIVSKFIIQGHHHHLIFANLKCKRLQTFLKFPRMLSFQWSMFSFGSLLWHDLLIFIPLYWFSVKVLIADTMNYFILKVHEINWTDFYHVTLWSCSIWPSQKTEATVAVRHFS